MALLGKRVSRFIFGSRQRMQKEEKAMTHMRRVRSMACVLVAVTLIVALLAEAPSPRVRDDGKKIVTLRSLN